MNSPITLQSLPLFPLHTVLFPDGYMALRVFEVRYLNMVRCCREMGAPFGVVALTKGHEVLQAGAQAEKFHTVGTLASITSVESLGTGLDLVHCKGTDRFQIEQVRKLKYGLWVADATLLPTDKATPIPEDLRHTAAALMQVMRKVPQRHFQDAKPANFEDCGWVANRWSELLPMPDSTRLQLLQLDSPLLRLELVTDALERAGIVS